MQNNHSGMKLST